MKRRNPYAKEVKLNKIYRPKVVKSKKVYDRKKKDKSDENPPRL